MLSHPPFPHYGEITQMNNWAEMSGEKEITFCHETQLSDFSTKSNTLEIQHLFLQTSSTLGANFGLHT